MSVLITNILSFIFSSFDDIIQQTKTPFVFQLAVRYLQLVADVSLFKGYAATSDAVNVTLKIKINVSCFVLLEKNINVKRFVSRSAGQSRLYSSSLSLHRS